MNIKSLLLGSAAALVAVSGARAADAVVVAEPEPVEYVRVCDVYGAGFYYIPGTETCLKVSGYFRYDIGAGPLDVGYDIGIRDVIDRNDPVNADGTLNFDDTWRKRARFQLRVDARSETELGTLRAYMAYNVQYDTVATVGDIGLIDPNTGLALGATRETTNIFNNSIEHAYLELGGFRAGKTDSYFSTFTDYAGGVIHDDLIPYGPFDTMQLAYTYDAGNGFTAGVALEEGDGILYTLDSYTPNVVAGVGYTAGWGGIKFVAAYDSVWEQFAVKGRVDAKFNDMFSAFIMAGWADKDDLVDPATGFVLAESIGPNYYGGWGGDWGIWGGFTAQVTPKAAINVQLSYDDFEDFAAVANVAYELVPGLTITPEIMYTDNFNDDDDIFDIDDDSNNWAGFLRLQRNF